MFRKGKTGAFSRLSPGELSTGELFSSHSVPLST